MATGPGPPYGYAMLLILSPAKAMNFDDVPAAPMTTPQLKEDIALLAQTTVKLRELDLRRPSPSMVTFIKGCRRGPWTRRA